MSPTLLPPLRLGRHTARLPIVQGGMGVRISGASLASAVAEAGGVGLIAAVGLGLDSPYFDPQHQPLSQRREHFFTANRLALRDEVQRARRLSPAGILGVNVMVAVRDYEVLVRTAAENGANLIVSGAGLPLRLPAYTANYPEVALVPIVASARAAQIICRKWERQHQRLPDALIIEDPRVAGGHLGSTAEELVADTWDLQVELAAMLEYLRADLQVPIPVIVAGGIRQRADLDRLLAAGASGVQLGTPFIATYECDAHPRYKQAHLQARPEDLVLVPSPVGLPGRALNNAFAQQAIAGTVNQTAICLNCLNQCKFRDRRETYCILHALDRAARGDVEQGLVFSGSGRDRPAELRSVAAVMAALTAPVAAVSG